MGAASVSGRDCLAGEGAPLWTESGRRSGQGSLVRTAGRRWSALAVSGDELLEYDGGLRECDDMNIRQATVADIPSIQRLYRQLDEHHVRLLPRVFHCVDGDARPDACIAQSIEDSNADYLLAEEYGAIVGFVDVRKSSHPQYPMYRPHEFVLIENAVVDSDHRGQGIGRALFEATLQWAEGHGVRHVQTTVWYDNVGAREFYVSPDILTCGGVSLYLCWFLDR